MKQIDCVINTLSHLRGQTQPPLTKIAAILIIMRKRRPMTCAEIQKEMGSNSSISSALDSAFRQGDLTYRSRPCVTNGATQGVRLYNVTPKGIELARPYLPTPKPATA